MFRTGTLRISADPEVWSATVADIPCVVRLMETSGIVVAESSLRARVSSEEGGIVMTADGCASWAIDSGALHVYDFAGTPEALPALVDAVNVIARAQFAAVLTVTLYDDDRLFPEWRASGFEDDWVDPAIRGGQAVHLVGLVREVR